VILETLRAELAVGFIEKEKKNESGKIVFSKGGASVNDDFHDDGHAGARAFRPTAQEQPAPGGEMVAARRALTSPFPFLWRSLLSLQFLARRSRWTRQQ